MSNTEARDMEDEREPSSPNRAPAYRGGHFDTSVDDFPIVSDSPFLRTGWIPIGDDPDGPAVAIVVIPPGMEAMEGPPHFHNSAQVRVILEGSMKIGPTWYCKGDIRIQKEGMTYGPEVHGSEGSTELLFFANRRGMFPHYKELDASAFGALMSSSGIEPL
jgi:hypothetical protein